MNKFAYLMLTATLVALAVVSYGIFYGRLITALLATLTAMICVTLTAALGEKRRYRHAK